MKKMSKKAFIEYGNEKLYLLFSIIVFEYLPILFVAYDEKDQLYLVFCSESREIMRWVIGKTNIRTIEAVLNQDMTINEALGCEEAGRIMVVKFSKTEGYSIEETSLCEVDPYYLTESGVYAEFIEDDVEENLKQYKESRLYKDRVLMKYEGDTLSRDIQEVITGEAGHIDMCEDWIAQLVMADDVVRHSETEKARLSSMPDFANAA